MTKEKGATNHSEPSESINPKITAKDIPSIEEAILKELLIYCKSEAEVILAEQVALDRAVILQLQEAVDVRDANYEKALETISVAAQKIDELRATNFLQMKAVSTRLEKLESS